MWALQDDRGLPVSTPVSLSLPCPLPPSGGTSSLTPARWPLAHRFLGLHVWPSPAAPLTEGRAHKSGVEFIAQAGGSVRDDHVIMTCDKYGIAMAFTGVRLFHH